MKITDLNIDCLLRIFKYLSERELVILCETSNYFNAVIEQNIFYAMTKDLLLCGHRNRPSVEKRNRTQLTYFRRLQVARNWLRGVYMERHYYHHAQMFSSKLWLDSDALYITHANYLRKYRRAGPEALQRRYEVEITTPTLSNIADFVKKQDTIFAGRVCGACFVNDTDGITEQAMHHAKEYMFSVDFVNEVYATSTDTCCKLWKRSTEFGLTHFDLFMQLQHSFKSMKLSDDAQWLYGGLYTDTGRKALRAINVESGEEQVLNSNTISIYDLKIKDEHVLFTANFDTTFRMFDRRTDRDVAVWEDPFDSSIYCLEYDGLYAVLCGAKYHSRVNLYDIRVPGKYIQLYFPGRATARQNYRSSPVYSLACDSQYMFIATDHNLQVLDFTTNYGIQRDYSHFHESLR
ncbi:F-box/WD repeat-containing protein 4 [Drosophila novamexicana]|uniref:F-box/WD repeat-containing protein 4 n=1 Tax=Drosophila novamexicana TaxID=47314 RepID=UPI0011E5CEB6|nr:F-box/WD repeat-containing protein 4 [Drosophila novamexicana]